MSQAQNARSTHAGAFLFAILQDACVIICQMKEAKTAIRKTVTDYKTLFPDEYVALKKAVEFKRNLTRDEYASVDGWFEGRGLYEISETLFHMLVSALTEEEMLWLKRGGLNGKEGGRWFAREYPEFALPNKI